MSEATKPIIVERNTLADNKKLLPFNMPSNLPGVVFLLLIVVIIGELIWGAWYIMQPLPSGSGSGYNEVFAQEEKKADIALASDLTAISNGERLPVKISIHGNGVKSFGSDVVIKYNPKIFQLSGTPAAVFAKGILYPEYVGQEVDNTNGIFRVSGLSNNPSNAPDLEGVFGTLNFTAIGPGTDTITVEHSAESTTDSNVIDAFGNNILKEISNLEISVN